MSYKENTEKQAFIKRVTIVVPGGENNFWMRYSIGAEYNGKKSPVLKKLLWDIHFMIIKGC